MSTWSRLADLRLTVDAVELVPRSLRVGPQFDRRTTVVRLGGGGVHGLGEDVTYDGADQERFQTATIEWPRGEFDLAALDLALRQSGRTLAERLERPQRPVRFVASMGLGQPPAMDRDSSDNETVLPASPLPPPPDGPGFGS